ncbi:hypothetical protein ACFSYB_02030 [Litchfieldia salsa]
MLKYKLTQDALNLYTLSLSTSINTQVRAFYKKIQNNTTELMEQCNELRIKHGLHQRLIYLPRTEVINKIQGQEFLGVMFGHNRPSIKCS